MSPYTGRALNVTYSAPSADEALDGAARAAAALRDAGVEQRVGVRLKP
ncbi:hypothetical protein P9209_21875 [Prescottella defluvii]|nr:hypothetical protein P9209_21875 [Prescottella defluvii]